MVAPIPLSLLSSLFARVARAVPPPWIVEESQRNLVLLLNHVLTREPQAPPRLAGHKGRKVHLQWRHFSLCLVVTPAGLFELVPEARDADLSVTVLEEAPWELIRATLHSEKPSVRIEGDVQFAAEINWLADHVRWDLEEDLSHLVGDAPSHALVQAGRVFLESLRKFVAAQPGGTTP
jgi:ubiquinone biosynthesis accessory factor UbiJ